MEMRKFVIELHSDGSMTWAEYTEPSTKEDRDYLCGRAFKDVSGYLDTYPASRWPPKVKAAYLAGAASMAEKLRKIL